MPLWYNLLWVLGGLIGWPFFLMTLVQPKRRATFLYRLAWRTGVPSADGRGHPPIWIHALSVGEVASAEPIIDRLRRCLPHQPLVFSTSTQTGMQTARRLFTGKVQSIFYYPYDLIFSVERVMHRVRPALVLIVETDIWPNFLFSLKRRGVPALLVNARLSNGSFRGYRLFGGFSRKVLGAFAGIGAQSDADASRFVCLGACAAKVVVTGNVKFDQKSSDAPVAEGRDLRVLMGINAGRAVLLLGSTHPGEETEGLGVFLRLKERLRDPLLIVVPRDPGRAAAIEKLVRARGLSVRLLSALAYDAAHDRCDVLVVNTIGLLRRLYAVADVTFVGGSLVRGGGHNPLEAAAYGKPILFGPDMSDFSAIADRLLHAGAAIRVHNSSEWHRTAAALLAAPGLRERMGRQALRVFESNKGAVDKTMRMIAQTVSADRGVCGCPDQNV